jgi:hypothetical protein
MCERAELMQGKYWTPMQADICCLMNGDHLEFGFLVAKAASRDEMGREWAENNQYLHFQHFDEGEGNSYTFNNWTFNKHNYIWLPTIEQLMDALKKNNDCLSGINYLQMITVRALDLFKEDCLAREYWLLFKTLQQFLLAYYMAIKNNLMWADVNGKWIVFDYEKIDILADEPINKKVVSNVELINNRLSKL